MKKAFYNILAVSMAFLVLLSTISFTVDKHFCGSMLVDLAVLSKAETCGMEMSGGTDVDANTVMKDSCCSNIKVEVAGQDQLKLSFESLNFNQQVFIASFVYSYSNLFEALPQQIIPFKDYSPPLLVADIQLVDQVFLI